MPYIYFAVLLIFLFLYSFLITLQLYKSLNLELSFQDLSLKTVEYNDLNDLFYILRIFSYKKLWFDSLKLVESQKNIPTEKAHHYFNVAGFIYQKMNKNNLAKLCYLRSLSKKVDCVVASSNLAKLQDEQ